MRYVVLRHEGVEEPHFDLMFEERAGSALKTWRVLVWPIEGEVKAERLGDHRSDYLEYEGEVSAGRGWVKRVEGGACAVEKRGEAGWVVRFEGGGGAELMKGESGWVVRALARGAGRI